MPYFSNNNINIGNSNLNQDNTNVAEAGRVLKLHFNQTWAKNETFDAAIPWNSRRSMGYDRNGIFEELTLAAALLWEVPVAIVQPLLERVGPLATMFGKHVLHALTRF